MPAKTITAAASVKQWKHLHTTTTHREIRMTVPAPAHDHVQAVADLIGVSRCALIVHLMCAAGPATDELRRAVEATAAQLGVRIVLSGTRGKRYRLGGPR